MRSIDSVLSEFRRENHEPMAKFVETLKEQLWVNKLVFDLSMLRLWIARRGADRVEAMVVYGDGRGGGRPSPPYVDLYEFSINVENLQTGICNQNLELTVQKVGRWLENAERTSPLPTTPARR